MLSVQDKKNPPGVSDIAQKLMVVGLVLDIYDWASFLYVFFRLIGTAFVYIIYKETRGYLQSKQMIITRRLASKRPSPPHMKRRTIIVFVLALFPMLKKWSTRRFNGFLVSFAKEIL
jgi:hypothetical protein